MQPRRKKKRNLILEEPFQTWNERNVVVSHPGLLGFWIQSVEAALGARSYRGILEGTTVDDTFVTADIVGLVKREKRLNSLQSLRVTLRKQRQKRGWEVWTESGSNGDERPLQLLRCRAA
jgi:hypothetical protein